MYGAAIACGVPLLVAAVRRIPRGARAWVVAWSTLNFLEGGAEFVLAQKGYHNLWLPYVFQPIEGAAALWAFSCWQESEVARLTMRVAIVPLVVVEVIASVFLENTAFFSRAVIPLTSLVGLYAAASTLVAKSHASTGDLLRQDWLWISTGAALFFATISMFGPLSALLLSNLRLFVLAYQVEAAITILAFLAIAWGMWLPNSDSAVEASAAPGRAN